MPLPTHTNCCCISSKPSPTAPGSPKLSVAHLVSDPKTACIGCYTPKQCPVSPQRSQLTHAGLAPLCLPQGTHPHPVPACLGTSYHPQLASKKVLGFPYICSLGLLSRARHGETVQGFVCSPAPTAPSEEHQPGFSFLSQCVLSKAGGGPAEPPEHMAGSSVPGAAAFDLIEHNEQHGTLGDAPSA